VGPAGGGLPYENWMKRKRVQLEEKIGELIDRGELGPNKDHEPRRQHAKSDGEGVLCQWDTRTLQGSTDGGVWFLVKRVPESKSSCTIEKGRAGYPAISGLLNGW